MFLRRLMWSLVIGSMPFALWAQAQQEDIARPRPAQVAQSEETQPPAETQAPNASKPAPGGFKHAGADHASGELSSRPEPAFC